jgi:hypothetical protein
MIRTAVSVVGLVCGLLAAVPGVARAQDGAKAEEGVAAGFVVQPRIETQSSLLGGVLGSPGFLLGFRTGNVTVGIGGNFTRTDVSAMATGATTRDELSLTTFQVMPSVAYDVWHSADGRARFDVAGAVGYGHASVNVSSGGTSSTDLSIGYIPFRLGVGADYFLSRNFALGGEAGFQSKILTSASEMGMNQDIAVSDSAGYGAIRLTFVIGD